MPYILGTKDGRTLQIIRAIPDPEATKILESNAALSRFSESLLPFSIFCHGQQDLLDGYKHLSKLVSSDPDFQSINPEFIIPFANKVILNYLSSVAMFNDHSKTYLAAQFGRKSEQFCYFKTQVEGKYTSNNEYRLLLDLRSYGLHHTFPVHTVEVTQTRRDNEEFDTVIRILLRRDKLLEKGQIPTKTKSYIRTLPEVFDFEPYIPTGKRMVYDLLRIMLTMISKEIETDFHFLNRYYEETLSFPGAAGLWNMEHFQNPKPKMQITLFPEFALDTLRRYFLPNSGPANGV